MSRENFSPRDTLNLLIYDYLLKNNLSNAAAALKNEANLSDSPVPESSDLLYTLFNQFTETLEVRSGLRIYPDNLARIEGVMMKLENEKLRYSRFRSPSLSSPLPRRPVDPRMPVNSIVNHDTYNFGTGLSQDIACKTTPPILVESKRIDLIIKNIVISCFCPQNNILIFATANRQIYFYNLNSNEIEYEFICHSGLVKTMKTKEVNNTIYIAYSTDDRVIRLCKYENIKKDDIKVFEFEKPFRSFCLAKDSILVLGDSGIKSFTFLGVCTGASKPLLALSIDCIGNKIILAEQSRIIEYDLRADKESNIIATSLGYPTVKVKNEEAFLILHDSIQVIDAQYGAVLSSVKSTIPCKDVALFEGTVAVCTPTDLFYASDVIPGKNLIEISTCVFDGAKMLLSVTSDGFIILYKKLYGLEK